MLTFIIAFVVITYSVYKVIKPGKEAGSIHIKKSTLWQLPGIAAAFLIPMCIADVISLCFLDKVGEVVGCGLFVAVITLYMAVRKSPEKLEAAKLFACCSVPMYTGIIELMQKIAISDEASSFLVALKAQGNGLEAGIIVGLIGFLFAEKDDAPIRKVEQWIGKQRAKALRLSIRFYFACNTRLGKLNALLKSLVCTARSYLRVVWQALFEAVSDAYSEFCMACAGLLGYLFGIITLIAAATAKVAADKPARMPTISEDTDIYRLPITGEPTPRPFSSAGGKRRMRRQKRRSQTPDATNPQRRWRLASLYPKILRRNNKNE